MAKRLTKRPKYKIEQIPVSEPPERKAARALCESFPHVAEFGADGFIQRVRVQASKHLGRRRVFTAYANANYQPLFDARAVDALEAVMAHNMEMLPGLALVLHAHGLTNDLARRWEYLAHDYGLDGIWLVLPYVAPANVEGLCAAVRATAVPGRVLIGPNVALDCPAAERMAADSPLWRAVDRLATVTGQHAFRNRLDVVAESPVGRAALAHRQRFFAPAPPL